MASRRIKQLRAQARALHVEGEKLMRQADALFVRQERGYKTLYKEAKVKFKESDAVVKEIVSEYDI